MCGILYAKLRDNFNSEFSTIFKDALNLMAYRGKDAVGYHSQSNNYFGHSRLSILDLSTRSNQPIVNQNNILLFKGEIYNYKQLISHAHSDTLAIAELVERGIDIADKLCGMYAILTYSIQTQKVRVLRDFYGEKPVYYYCDEKIFIVSSTIKSINYILDKTFNIKLKINQDSLYEYFLCGYVREPKTIYENIHMLSSGHALNFSEDWKISIDNIFHKIRYNKSLSPKEHAEQCLQTTDVQPGLLLSSGVDSTYILNLMQNTNDGFKVLTYKAPNPYQDESNAAIINVNKICKDKNVQIDVIENHENIYELWTNYPTLLEQPTSDGMNLFNILSVSRKYDDKLKLIILGTGGDELHGGYHSFNNLKKISFLRKLTYIKTLLPIKYRRFFEINQNKETQIESYYFLYRICHKLLPHTPKNIVNRLFSEFVKEMKKYSHEQLDNPYSKVKLFESFDYMRNQLLRDADNISLFCGYEARNPLLSIPAFDQEPDYKIKMKNILRYEHNVTFMRKKGFTFCENESGICHSLSKQIREYNKKYNLLSEQLIKKLFNIDLPDFNLIRKTFILFSWLEANKINNDQLQGFTI